MLNFATTLVVLVVGLSLVATIIWNRLAPHVGSILFKTAVRIKFPVTKVVDLDLNGPGRPKRVVLSFR